MRRKQKALLPSLREKKRYVVFEVLGNKTLNISEVKDVIINAYRFLFGEIGLAKAGVDFVEYKEGKGILKVSNKYLDNIKASFCFVRKVNKEGILLRSLGVSGILNKARLKFMSGGGL